MQRPSARRERGFTFVEVMGAAMLVAVFLSGAFYANSRGLNMLRSSRETAIASKILQERMEELRGMTWTDVTDSSSLKSNYATATDSAAGLAPNILTETLTVTAWPTAGTAIKITRSATGTVALVTDNVDLDVQSAVLITVRAAWTGAGARSRVRETSTVIANGGLGR